MCTNTLTPSHFATAFATVCVPSTSVTKKSELS